MKPFSSSPCSNEHKAQKRPISVITIESHDDDVVNEVFSSSAAAVKRGKNETTTERIEDEASTSAESLKEDGDIEDSLQDFTAAQVSNASNLTNDAEVQLDENLVQDSLKKQSLVAAETSAKRFDALNDSENGNNSKSFNIIKAPNFKFETTSKGNKRLIVFDPNDKTICYHFYGNHYWKFHCAGCIRAHHKTVAAKILKDENGEDYVQMVHQHLCQPVKYVPPSERQQHEIIHAPNYELQVKLNGYRKLVVFVATIPNLCYYYQHVRSNYFVCYECKKSHKKHISAKVLTDKEGTQYVQANVPHLYVPNFVLETTTTRNKRLVVFVADDKTMCYEFYKKRELYRCQKCLEAHKKTVAAKVLKDENGDDYVQMVRQHLCIPVNYVSQSPNFQIQQHEIINASNYEIQLTQSGKRVLVIFVLTNPNLCYYYRNKVKDYFVCCQCENNKKTISAKLLTDKEGTQYVQANVRHICEPVPYVANKWSSKIIQ